MFRCIGSERMYNLGSHHMLLVVVPKCFLLHCACIDGANNMHYYFRTNHTYRFTRIVGLGQQRCLRDNCTSCLGHKMGPFSYDSTLHRPFCALKTLKLLYRPCKFSLLSKCVTWVDQVNL